MPLLKLAAVHFEDTRNRLRDGEVTNELGHKHQDLGLVVGCVILLQENKDRCTTVITGHTIEPTGHKDSVSK